MEKKRVVITGLGALTPIGNSVDEYWNNLIAGKSGADFITKFDAGLFKTQFACEVKDFDPLSIMDRKEVRKLDPFSVYAMATAQEALADSNIDLEKVDLYRAGVVWGSGIGGMKTFQEECFNYKEGDGTPRFNPFFVPKMIVDIAAGHISIKYGLKGPNYVTVSACASSTNALIDSLMLIQLGKCDFIISGGSEAGVNIAGVGGFNALKALSTRNDNPKTASRPFDSTRDGFVLGEGSGCLILEELEHAKARGAKIYAEVVGGGLTADAHHITAPHPEGLGAINVMKLSLEDAGMKPEDIDYINVHGTSTPLGDIAETIAIKEVFGDHAYNLNISSTKSMTGHLLGAAGAIEAIACVKSIENDIVPPTINFEHKDESIDYNLNLTLNKAQERTVNAALSNTFGFGGHNTSIIMKKYND
ncbi:MAG: beta-ketoacyl-[acyl-carrier-protein] synthase II [Crocinitomicaceae bacterium]|nr:beta-ketoacyl-[acyl-carrier-protein] synthase II [Crocinitomicaceae bacterium]|tara:strand:- start:7483 stop:8736 length:1254 start_codon:yes stop_codon:yes gene_type:complete